MNAQAVCHQRAIAGHIRSGWTCLLGLLWAGLSWGQSSVPTANDLADLMSTPNRAIALSPDGDSLLVSYHPGRLSMLGLIDRTNGDFTLLHASHQRLRFEARFEGNDRLWLFSRPEEGCSPDQTQTLLQISLPQARRHQAIRLSTRHSLGRSSAVRLSLSDRVNRRIRQLTALWGSVEQLDWAAVREQPLPDHHCPSHWASDRLVLDSANRGRHLYRPDRPADLLLSGQQWLIDDDHQLRAQLDPSGLLVRPGSASVHLGAADHWQLLGLDGNAQLLLLGPGQDPSGAMALYRMSETGPELLFQPEARWIDPARTLMLGIEAIAVRGTAEHDPRLLLDARHSNWIRDIEAQIGPIKRIIGQSSDHGIQAIETESGFWISEHGQSLELLESARPWFSPSDQAPASIRTLHAPDSELLPSERLALKSRGIDQRSASEPDSVPHPDDCVWSRRLINQATRTDIQCGSRQQHWIVSLSEERDDERVARVEAMIRFMIQGPSES